MFTRERCPVCDQTDTTVLDTISPQALVEAYCATGLVADFQAARPSSRTSAHALSH